MIPVVITLAAASWLSFAGWYMIRARWWESAYGWNTLGTSLVLAVIFARLALLTFAPELRADLYWTGLGLYVSATVLGAHRIYLMEKAQRQQK